MVIEANGREGKRRDGFRLSNSCRLGRSVQVFAAFFARLLKRAGLIKRGLVSNSPLMYVFDVSPQINALIVQVDLFSATGELPTNLDQVLERARTSSIRARHA
jgi:hypothetical protein